MPIDETGPKVTDSRPVHEANAISAIAALPFMVRFLIFILARNADADIFTTDDGSVSLLTSMGLTDEAPAKACEQIVVTLYFLPDWSVTVSGNVKDVIFSSGLKFVTAASVSLKTPYSTKPTVNLL